MSCALPLLLLFFSFYLHSDALECYSCFTDKSDSECYSNASVLATDTCLLPTAFCQVWSLVAESDGLVYMFERGCTESCSDGCVSLADIENRFASCTSCCSEDFCNTDKVAPAISRTQPHFWIVALLLHTYL